MSEANRARMWLWEGIQEMGGLGKPEEPLPEEPYPELDDPPVGPSGMGVAGHMTLVAVTTCVEVW